SLDPLFGTRRADLDVDVVEVRVIQAATVTTAPSRGERRHLDRLTFRNDCAERLHLDEAIAEILDGGREFSRDVVNAQIGSTELPHPTRVVPDAPWSLFVADKDHDVMAGHCAGRLESPRAPLLGAPPLEHVRIEHCHSAAL